MTIETQGTEQPLIIGFVSDLMFSARIAAVVQKNGFRIDWIEDAKDMGADEADVLKEPPGEMLYGREGKLFEKITDWQPALLLFDLNSSLPWSRWIPVLKSSPATRRIPIMCFGPHENIEIMNEARRIGADVVLARSRFTSDMANLFQKYARIPDQAALAAACSEPIAELAKKGIELFNAGEYYKCHDALEEAWMEDRGPGRDLYRGILQVGIALYQVQRGNYRGAVKMLLRVRQWLEPLPEICRGVDVARLRETVQRVYDQVITLGAENLKGFDWSVVNMIDYTKE